LLSSAGPTPRVRGAHVERARDLDHALRPHAEQPAEADELRQRLVLELLQLGELARLDELDEPALDALADAAQVADASRAHEVGHRRGSCAHQLGGAAVGAHGVVLRTGQVEEPCQRLEPVGDLGVRELGHRQGS
jgi:hypothetical protein